MASLRMIIIMSMAIMLCESKSVHDELKEPLCSKYAFEESLLERSVRTDFAVQMMDKKLKEWEERIEKAMGQLKEQKDTLDNTHQTVVSKTEEIITNLQEKANNIVSDLNEKVSRMSEDLSKETRNMNETLKSFLEDSTVKLETAKDELITPPVSFYARDVATNSPSFGSVIRFTSNLVNVGNGYNSGTGYFTAPHDGVYMFMVQICTNINKYIDIQIIAAGTAVAGLRQYDKGDQTAICTSGMAMTTLKAGDQVWVKCSSRSPGAVIYNYSNDRYTSSFSSVLLNRGVP